MFPDSYRLYKYGDKFKLVYYKVGSGTKKKKRSDCLADLYETFGGAIRDEHLYNEAYLCYQSRLDKRSELAFPPCSDVGAQKRFSQSLSRTKSRVFELAMCNEFSLFCTFTIDPNKMDNYDIKVFSKGFGQFIRNYNRDRVDSDKVRYLIIPEQHRNGAWHAHGLLLGLSERDLFVNENGYLDWAEYKQRFGFVSLDKIKDKAACSAYITKYITKDLAISCRAANAHLYFASQGLLGRSTVAYGDGHSQCFNGSFDFENDYIKTKWFDDVESVENFFTQN